MKIRGTLGDDLRGHWSLKSPYPVPPIGCVFPTAPFHLTQNLESLKVSINLDVASKKRTLHFETFEKCSILFKAKAILQDSRIGQPPGCPQGRGAWTPRVNAKILTTGIHLVF
ncbi:MAG: hypothetical protein SRB2_00077 [Desulfobacteraceae bacterium Eth-SRB2]|nr:MAG: hypothetical protein SRB2_00077 [Desulfobacteraceae bacterium Eth-SRB2]